MELYKVGKQCHWKECRQLDYLPFTCEGCKESFCHEHWKASSHSCPQDVLEHGQIRCLMCQTMLKVPNNQSVDRVVSDHIDRGCNTQGVGKDKQPSTGRQTKPTRIHMCHLEDCKKKEVVKFECRDCKYNFCIKHRHPLDHKCSGPAVKQSRGGFTFPSGQKVNSHFQKIGTSITSWLSGKKRYDTQLSEEEQLQLAIAESLVRA
ncbi:hypothetical protein MIR68_007304 [Amoeboaphelidium protococcarum]|nr:hypothetical protein MIR68_007304 [Amoeboaphelidium protococcarum]